MASKKGVTVENLAALGSDRLVGILMALAKDDADVQRRLRLELAGQAGSEDIAADWRKSRDFIKDLDRQRAMIVDRVASSRPDLALDLMWRFMSLEDSVFNALAQSGLPIRNIQVDVAPLRANAGDQTVSWVQQGLPDQLAQALAGRMMAQGGTLVVRIDYVTLGPIKDSSAWDNISGVAMIGGVQWPVRAIAKYQASSIDQEMFEESNHRRVTQLLQALTYWLAGDL